MNQENRQRVLNYCAEYSTPLYFNGYESNKEEFDPSKYSIESMVRRVLELSELYASYNANTDEFESSKDRWRSCLDIWRHIIYYYPTIEIFDVMHEVYAMIPNKLRGQFCNDIERRTFKNRTEHADIIINHQTAKRMDLYANRTTDEFDLDWEDWKDI